MPAPRPTRLSRAFLAVGGLLLLASFITGLLLWQVAQLQAAGAEPPAWRQAARIIHGATNPLLCILFGCLWAGHIAGGWKMQANRPSGVPLVLLLSLLIATGWGLYYLEARALLFWSHLVAGLLLPPLLTWHWLAARRWAAARERAE